MFKFLLILFIISTPCHAGVVIDIDKIVQIESSGNASAYNRHSGARGLCQITPIVLEEYNHFNKTHYGLKSLFTPKINVMIAEWYLNQRIPQMFKAFHIKDTVENRLVAYNAGIVYARNGYKPKETINYIKKYWGIYSK